MLLAMIVLACACTVIGVLPGFFVPLAVKTTASTGLIDVAVPIEPFLELTGNITRVAVIFLVGLVAVMLLRLALYRGKTVTRSGTWGCGFTQPTVRMQYTGTSYAASILEFFRAVAPLRVQQQNVKGCFPATGSYHSHIEDVAESNSSRLIVRPVMAFFDRLRWIQHGDIHLYIGYILLAIVGLMVFVWRG